MRLLRAVVAWALALGAPAAIWALVLATLELRAANLAGLALEAALGALLGLLAARRRQAAALALVALAIRPSTLLVGFAVGLGTALGRFAGERRGEAATPHEPVHLLAALLELAPGAFPRLAGALRDGLRLAWSALLPVEPPTDLQITRRFVGVLLALLLLHEAELRLHGRDDFAQLEKYADWSQPHPYLWYQLNPDYGGTNNNRHGFPLATFDWPKAPGTRRVVVLGASAVHNGTRKTSVSAVLERELAGRLPDRKLECLNAGFPCTTSQLLLVQLATRVLELEPDVIVLYLGENDFVRDSTKGARTVPGDASSDLARDDAFRTSFRDTTPIARWLARRSRVLGNALVRSGAIQRTSAENIFPFEEPDPLTAVLCGAGPRSALTVLAPPSPPREERSSEPRDLARFYRRNLDKMIGLARHAGAKVVLCTLAMKLTPATRSIFRSSEAWEELGPRVTALHAAMNAHARELAAERGVPLVELEGRLDQERHFIDAVHWNEAGGEIVARAMADVLASPGGPLDAR